MNVETFYPFFLNSKRMVIDSRNVESGDVFFAFSGENFNAALYAEEAIQKGAVAVIVEQKEYENKDKNIFYVPSTLKFLQDLSSYHRSLLEIPIIALTGSNGKTTTKELINSVLSKKYKTQYTKGNLNNHIGVPLTLLSIKPEHEIAVVEMGANHGKEIEFLCSLAKPNIGYITNFGKAHLEGFGGFEGVIKAKSEMYDYLIQNGQVILVNENDPIQVEKTQDYSLKITFGKADSDYLFDLYSHDHRVGVVYHDVWVLSNLTGEYNFTNICAAFSLGNHFGVSVEKIKEAIEEYKPTNMRSQIMHKEDKVLLLDTYNANPSSMNASLRNFSTYSGSKTVILGDMLELGDESENEHKEILTLAKSLDFDEIITVGNNFKKINDSQESFLNTEELKSYLKQNSIKSKNILLKGSRGIALENIIEEI